MWKLLSIAAALAFLTAGSGVAAQAPAYASYGLDVGDQVRIKVFERSASGDVHEWSALNSDYRLGADGTISLPLLGSVKAAGLTVEQLAEAVSTRLQTSVGLATRPQASVEVVQYRPFYILGDVNKPGEYPYRPGLTVIQAISIAGGLYRVSDPGLLLTTTGDLRVYRLQYNGLLARRARLQAELDNVSAIAFPPELTQRQDDPNVAQLMGQETALFNAHRDAMQSQMDALTQLKSLLNGEVASLQSKSKNVDQELVLLKEQIDSTTSLVERGLSIVPREYSLRETQLETQDRRLDLDTASLRAREDIGKADQAIADLRSKTRTDAETELADVERKISETAARIATGSTIVDRQIGGAVGRSASAEVDPPLFLILRPSGETLQQIQAEEETLVVPGDTVKVQRAGGNGPESTAAAAPAPPPAK
jgi:protein involved in polysaccharide export with SLBB domain